MRRIRQYSICSKCKADKKATSSSYCNQCSKDYYNQKKGEINEQRRLWRENKVNPKFDYGREYENINLESTIEEARKLLYKFKYGITDSTSIYQLIDIYINLFGYKSVDYYGKSLEEQIIKMLKSIKQKFIEHKPFLSDLSTKKIETTKDMEEVKQDKFDTPKPVKINLTMQSQLSIAEKAAEELKIEKDELMIRLGEIENLLDIQSKIVSILKGEKTLAMSDTRKYNRNYYHTVTKFRKKNKLSQNN